MVQTALRLSRARERAESELRKAESDSQARVFQNVLEATGWLALGRESPVPSESPTYTKFTENRR